MRFSTQTILWCVVIAQSIVIVALVIPKFSGDHTKASAAATEAEKRSHTRVERAKDDSPPASKGRRYYKDPTDPTWIRMAAKLNPDSAREMLERNAREITNVEERAEKAWLIISQLCRNGYTKEAWDLIDPNDGAVRQKALGGFFRDAALPDDELIGMLDGLKTADRSAGLYNFWSRFAPADFGKLDMARFPLKSGFETGAFKRAIGDLLTEANASGNPDATRLVRADLLSKLADQTNTGRISYNEFAEVLSKDPAKDGFLYWDVTKQVDDKFKEGQRSFDGTDAQVIRLMTAQDPERTVSMAIVPGTKEYSYYHIAMMEWLNKDFKSGEVWYNNHVGAMTEEEQDRSAVAFARASVRAGNLDVGEAWIGKIKSNRWFDAVSYERGEIKRNKGVAGQ